MDIICIKHYAYTDLEKFQIFNIILIKVSSSLLLLRNMNMLQQNFSLFQIFL
jgi:hypothetical protein